MKDRSTPAAPLGPQVFGSVDCQSRRLLAITLPQLSGRRLKPNGAPAHLTITTTPSAEFVTDPDWFVLTRDPVAESNELTLTDENEVLELRNDIAAVSSVGTSAESIIIVPFSKVIPCPLPMTAASTKLAAKGKIIWRKVIMFVGRR